MGYEVQTKTIRLIFTDPTFEGLEVEARVIPLHTLREAASLQEVATRNMTPADLEKVDRLIETFGRNLVSWNCEIDGQPVPATVEGVQSLDLLFSLTLITHWIEQVGRVLQADHDETKAQLVQRAAEDKELESTLGVRVQ